ncbi:phosphotriesterase [Streptomyces sp. NPDC042319]|uniref:phosphotriesterase family protein n=1 Tax=Streptomyces sp. NPDC042319 TaxID=3154332 RepID=UPI0033E1CD5A
MATPGRLAEPSSAALRTVLGDLPPDTLEGRCDAHDHLFLTSPQLPGQELDDPAAAAAELRAFKEAGGGTMVQWTPYGMGRRAAELVRLSRETGVRIVAATGLHQAGHYAPDLLDRVRGDLAALFVAELTEGTGGPGGPRAGLIKVAGGFHGLDAHARHTFAAAAEAHHATGAAIAVHLELGTGALDVLDLLCGTAGVEPEYVVLGHLNRFPEAAVHRAAAEAGAYLAFDSPSRTHHATDWRLPDTLAALVDAGFGDRLLLGGDTTTAAARSVDCGPGLPYVVGGLPRRLSLTLEEAAVERMLTDNPARAFAAEWRA